jgi:hypothetical protein
MALRTRIEFAAKPGGIAKLRVMKNLRDAFGWELAVSKARVDAGFIMVTSQDVEPVASLLRPDCTYVRYSLPVDLDVALARLGGVTRRIAARLLGRFVIGLEWVETSVWGNK